MKKKPVSIATNIKAVQEHAEKSYGLWRSVNFHLLKILKSRQSRAEIIRRLHAAAGPRKKGEMTCLSNYRGAARQLKDGQ